MKLAYLASAYGHEDPRVRQARYETVLHVAGQIMSQQPVMVYSPIVNNHLIDISPEPSDKHDFWLPRDFEVLSRCDELWILQSEGWQQSRGIKAEARFAERTANKPIIYLDPKCASCGSPETYFRPCPYAQDIHGEKVLIWLCEDCYQTRADTI